MATIDSSLVRKDIKKLNKTSQAVKKQVKNAFEQLEEDPSVFEELKHIPREILNRFHNLTLRKIQIRSHRHDYRIIFAHWLVDEEEGKEHVDLLLVFRRRDGYRIDWEWMESQLFSRSRF